MVVTSSRILSCEVWLILMRNTSAPASNRRRIIALSEDAGPRVARILMRRRRLISWPRAPAADWRLPAAFHRAHWAGREAHPVRGRREVPAGAAQAVRWT